MLTVVIILLILWIIYLGGRQIGKAEKKIIRVLEIEIEALTAKKEELDAIIHKADHNLAQRLAENNAKAQEEFQKTKQALDDEINKIRSQKLAEIERETAAEKMAAVKGLHRWAEQEKQRLQKRFDQEYERKLEDIKKLK